jgi:cytidylate kinase
LRITQQVVQKAASEGNCIVVGRGSQHFLRDRTDTLRIFLYAPREAKLRRLTAGCLDDKEAQEAVDTVDNERSAFIEKYFHIEWPNRPIYHALLNTAVGDEIVIETIMGLKKHLEL